MSSQSDRVDTALRQLHEAEQERRHVAASGDRPDQARHSELANEIQRIIADLGPGDVRSMVTVMVVDRLNGQKWARCESCGRPDYLGEAKPRTEAAKP